MSAVPVTENGSAAKPEYHPTMSGTFHGYKPQWKHSAGWGEALNKKLIGLEGGDKWTDVPYETIRGILSITFNGQVIPVGVPFPRRLPGILETISMCGYEQAMALAWAFSAHISAAGGEVEVRAETYELHYDIKAKLYEGKKST